MDGITERQCKSVLENYFNDSNFEIVDFAHLESFSSCKGYLSSVGNLLINTKRDGKLLELKFFYKKIPTENKFQQQYGEHTRCFLKEFGFYNQILRYLEPYMDKSVVPQCYLVEESKFIILEDLTQLGFKILNERKFLDIKHCRSALESIAILQTASLIWEHNNNMGLDAKFPDLLHESYFVRNPNHLGFKHLCTSIKSIEMLLQEPEFNTYSTEVKRGALNICKNVPEMFSPSKKSRNVIINGDLWWNNIMFSDDLGVTSSRLIDFQLIQYRPPAMEVMLLLHLNTDYDFRKKYLSQLLGKYFSFLHLQLGKYNQNPDEILSWTHFEDSILEVMPAVLALSLLYLLWVLIPEECMKGILQSSEKFENFLTENKADVVKKVYMNDSIYKNRVSKAISELLDHVRSSY